MLKRATLLAIASCLWGGLTVGAKTPPPRPAPPEALTLIGKQDGYAVYIDPESVVRNFPVVHLKVRVVPTEFGQSATTDTEMSVDCGAALIRVFQITAYTAQGKVRGVRQFGLDQPPMLASDLGQLSQPFLKAVCSN